MLRRATNKPVMMREHSGICKSERELKVECGSLAPAFEAFSLAKSNSKTCGQEMKRPPGFSPQLTRESAGLISSQSSFFCLRLPRPRQLNQACSSCAEPLPASAYPPSSPARSSATKIPAISRSPPLEAGPDGSPFDFRRVSEPPNPRLQSVSFVATTPCSPALANPPEWFGEPSPVSRSGSRRLFHTRFPRNRTAAAPWTAAERAASGVFRDPPVLVSHERALIAFLY